MKKILTVIAVLTVAFVSTSDLSAQTYVSQSRSGHYSSSSSYSHGYGPGGSYSNGSSAFKNVQRNSLSHFGPFGSGSQSQTSTYGGHRNHGTSKRFTPGGGWVQDSYANGTVFNRFDTSGFNKNQNGFNGFNRSAWNGNDFNANSRISQNPRGSTTGNINFEVNPFGGGFGNKFAQFRY